MVSYSQTGSASSIAPIALIPPVKALFLRAGAPGFLIWTVLSAPPTRKLLRGGGSASSFPSSLAIVADIFISVAAKNLNGHPKSAPYRGGLFGGGGWPHDEEETAIMVCASLNLCFGLIRHAIGVLDLSANPGSIFHSVL